MSVSVLGTAFIRMFLMHVLPKGFMRIRHYGLLSCRSKKEKMTLCRNLLGCQQYISKLKGKSTAEKIMILYKHDIRKCRCCGAPVTTFRVDGGIYAVLRYDNRIREKAVSSRRPACDAEKL